MVYHNFLNQTGPKRNQLLFQHVFIRGNSDQFSVIFVFVFLFAAKVTLCAGNFVTKISSGPLNLLIVNYLFTFMKLTL